MTELQVLGGRKPSVATLGCVYKNQSTQTMVQVAIFFAPSIVCTVFSAYKIKRLMEKIGTEIEHGRNSISNAQESSYTKSSAKKGLR